MTPRTGVIVVAGGSGHRMGGALPKQFRLLGGLPVLARTINAFAAALPQAPIVAVLPAEHIAFWKNLAARFDVAAHTVAAGGAERFHSVRNGLAALPADVELIAVHDGVRPLATPELIRRTAEAAAAHGAAIPVVVPTDSFRETDGEGSHPVDRSRLRAVQTPQIFEAALLRKAYQTEFSAAFTDDASVVERTGHPVFLCEGARRNFKITTPEDLLLAEAVIAADEDAGNGRSKAAEDPDEEAAGRERTSGKTPEKPLSEAVAGTAEKKSDAELSGLHGAADGTGNGRATASFRENAPASEGGPNPASSRAANTDGTRPFAKEAEAHDEPSDELYGGGAGAIR